MITQKKSRAIQGEVVLHEAVHYLKRMWFSTTRGDYAEGKYVAILIDSELQEDGKLSVLITCRALGHRKVDWHRLAVWVKGPAQETLALGAPFNDRGQKYLPPLPPGEYSLQVGTCAGEEIFVQPPRATMPQAWGAAPAEDIRKQGSAVSKETEAAVGEIGAAATPAILDRLATLLRDADWNVRAAAAEEAGRLGPAAATEVVLDRLAHLLRDSNEGVRSAAAAALGRLGPAAATEAVQGVELNEPRVYHSLDVPVTATLRPIAAGLEAAFETQERDCAQRKVGFALIEADTGRVELSGEVTLDPVQSDAALWEGVWQGSARLTKPSELVFWVVAEGDR